MNCSYCGAELKTNHILEFSEAVVMENGDKIISPCCGICKHAICSQDVLSGIDVRQKVILLSGPCGAGKSSIGQYIFKKSGLRPVFKILLPERTVCFERDISRKGWTAGAEFIDKWYEQQAQLGAEIPGSIIDNSKETLEETVARHFPML